MDSNITQKQILDGHSDRVWCVRWNATGKLIASCGADKTIRIWSQQPNGKWTCQSVLTDAHMRTVRFVAWSHDGRFLASTSFDGTIAIWHRSKSEESGEEEWTVLYVLEGHENEVKAAAWSSDDAYLATCSRDKSVWIWEKIETANAVTNDSFLEQDDALEAIFECATVQTEHSQDVKRVQWHPKLNILASSSFDNKILLYHQGTDDFQVFASLNQHEGTVWAMDFNSDGSRLVSVSADESIKIWQPQRYEELIESLASLDQNSFAQLCTNWSVIASLSGYHKYPIYDCSWSPISGNIVTVGGDNSIHIFKDLNQDEPNSIPKFRQICEYRDAHDQDINSVHFNPVNASHFVTGSDDSFVFLWSLEQ